MSFLGFGKKFKHKRFEYNPRHYDPDLEDLKARMAKYDKDVDNTELTKERIRSGFRRNSSGYSSSSREAYDLAQRRSRKIFLLVLATLLFFTFIFLVYYLPQIAALFE